MSETGACTGMLIQQGHVGPDDNNKNLDQFLLVFVYAREIYQSLEVYHHWNNNYLSALVAEIFTQSTLEYMFQYASS